MDASIEQLRYDFWANSQFLDVATRLDPDTVDRVLTSSYPSIRETLLHIAWAEELWLERWQGRPFVPALDPADFPTVSEIRARIADVHRRQVGFLQGLSPEAFDSHVSHVVHRNQRLEFSLRQMAQHLMVHSAYHRGQLTTLFRQLGVEPPRTDYLIFVHISRSGGA